MPRLRRPLLAAAISLSTLGCLLAAAVLANFAPGPWVLVGLLLLPLTLGLPTTLATVTVLALWNGGTLWLPALMTVLLGFTLQCLAHATLGRWRRAEHHP